MQGAAKSNGACDSRTGGIQERPGAPARTGGTQTEGKKEEQEEEVEVKVL